MSQPEGLDYYSSNERSFTDDWILREHSPVAVMICKESSSNGTGVWTNALGGEGEVSSPPI